MNTRIATNKDNIVKHTAQMEKQRGTLLTLENDLKNVNKAIEDQSNKFLNASKRFSEASSTLEKVGSGMSDIGGKIAMLSSPLLLFGTYASNAGITFEKICLKYQLQQDLHLMMLNIYLKEQNN